jgi:hypothetical protein
MPSGGWLIGRTGNGIILCGERRLAYWMTNAFERQDDRKDQTYHLDEMVAAVERHLGHATKSATFRPRESGSGNI